MAGIFVCSIICHTVREANSLRKEWYIMTEMTIERAIDNAIASTEMEGFTVTEKQKELIKKLMNKEITINDALEELNNKNSD